MRAAAVLQANQEQKSHVDKFQQDILNTCGQFKITPNGANPNALGDVDVFQRAGFDYAKIDIGRASVQRGKREIRKSDSDPYFLILQTRGKGEMRHAGSVTCLNPGDIYIVDSSKPSDFGFHEDQNQQLSFHLHRDEVHHRFGALLQGGLYISNKARESLVFRSAICGVASAESCEARREDFFELLGSYLRATETGASPVAAVHAPLVSAALAAIGAQYRDPDFTPAELADTLGVPLRRLQRAFNKVGTTPRKAILDTRLRSAHALLPLVRTSCGARSFTELAYSQGFGDLSYFYREYRKRYGKAPGKRPRYSASELEFVGPHSQEH